MGKTKSRAILDASQEVSFPLLLITLSILAVFAPAFLMSGVPRGMFIPLSLSVGFAIIASYTLSQTFVPVVANWWLKGHAHTSEHELSLLPDLAARQLGLPFPHDPDFSATDFLSAPANQAARAWLDNVEKWPSGRLALFGEPDVGKTHLLQLWARRGQALRVRGPALAGLMASIESTSDRRGVAIDDADLIADEPALLHLLNACAEAAVPVLLVGRAPPARWQVRLPDLASRLRAITAVEVEPPDDELLRSLLARLLAGRQLAVAAPVQAFLLTRLPRTAAALVETTCRLDRLALATGGRVTLRLAAQVVASFEGNAEDESLASDTGGASLL